MDCRAYPPPGTVMRLERVDLPASDHTSPDDGTKLAMAERRRANIARHCWRLVYPNGTSARIGLFVGVDEAKRFARGCGWIVLDEPADCRRTNAMADNPTALIDPDSTLVRIRWFTTGDGFDNLGRAYGELSQLFSALDKWLSDGGLAPAGWQVWPGQVEPTVWDEHPSAILARIRHNIDQARPDHPNVESYYYTIAEDIAGLDNWLSRGGIAPDEWAQR
jgi:hypothetical protein